LDSQQRAKVGNDFLIGPDGRKYMEAAYAATTGRLLGH